MELVFALAIVFVVAMAFAPAIKRYPWVLYCAAFALDVLYLISWFVGAPQWLWDYVLVYMQRCLLGISFFIVVMFVGVFDRNASLRVRLQPIRAELSVAASILCVSHIVAYGSSYIPNLALMLQAKGVSVTLALLVAAILVCLLATLTATSFDYVKKRMHAGAWRRLHRTSYLFYALVPVHLTAFLLPNIVRGNTTLLFEYLIYIALFAVYAVLKFWREAHRASVEVVAVQQVW